MPSNSLRQGQWISRISCAAPMGACGVLLLLAMAGIWHIGARLAGYKVLPMYQPSACGGPPHQLAYITEKERFDLIEATGAGKPRFGTQGVPCYPVLGKRRADAPHG